MQGAGGSPVLLAAMSPLLLLGSVVGQESTPLPSPTNTTSLPTPPIVGNWTVVEDGTLEISNFSGASITPPDLEKGRQLRIINSSIGALPADTFLGHRNITDATLEVVNTTIGMWHANTVQSFRAVTVINSVIRRLGSGAIRLRSASAAPCSEVGPTRVFITFSGTTIEWLETGALALDAGSTLLHLTDCTLGGLAGGALQLSLVTQLHVQDTTIGALAVDSLCRVCSARVLFERNQLLHVAPHALHFGSSRCAPGARDFACREVYAQRRVTISGTRLPCAPLGWLRDALASFGSLSEHVSGDYRELGATSHCTERSESVTSFLSREPEPEPKPEPATQPPVTQPPPTQPPPTEPPPTQTPPTQPPPTEPPPTQPPPTQPPPTQPPPTQPPPTQPPPTEPEPEPATEPEPEPEPGPEPAGGWCYSVSVTAGTAVALAVGFLSLGFLLGRCCCRTHAGAARLFGRADSRHMQPDEPVISLPLQNKTKDNADGENSSTSERYVTYPVFPSPKSRPPASIPPQQEQQSRLDVPQPQPEARQPSPRPARADQQRPRREQQRQQLPVPPAAADPEPIYENDRWQQNQPAETHLYGNLHDIKFK